MHIHHYRELTFAAHYVAAFNTWGAELRSSLVHDVRDWCNQTYGKIDRGDPNPRWQDDILWGEVRFRDESDLLAFLLRWE